MPKMTLKKEQKEARQILKPVLKAEKRLQKAAKALVVAKLALAHALVEAHIDGNATLSAWTEGVLSGDETSVRKIYLALTGKSAGKVKSAQPADALPLVPSGKIRAKPAVKTRPASPVARAGNSKAAPAQKPVRKPIKARPTPK